MSDEPSVPTSSSDDGQALGDAPPGTLRSVLGAVSDAVYVIELAGPVCRWANPSASELLGVSAGEFLRDGLEAVRRRIHPNDQERVAEEWRATRASGAGQPAGPSEYRILGADGAYRWVSDCRRVLHDERGRATILVATVRDITAYKQAEEDLAREKHFLDAIVDTAAALIVVLDTEGRIVRFNHACERASGYSADQVAGQVLWDLLVPPDEVEEVRRVFRTVVEEASAFDLECNWVTRDGSRRLIAWAHARVKDAEGRVTHVVATGVDVTDSRRLEEQVRRVARMEAVGQLAGGIAHDFNNVLTAIIGFVDLNLHQVPEGTVLHSDLKRIKSAARRGADLTQQLLAFSREQMVEPQVLELNASVAEAAKMLSHLIEEKIELKLQLASQPFRARINPVQLERVLVNMAVNARDAMPHGGVLTISTGVVTLGAEFAGAHGLDEGDYAVLTVADTGVGMTPEVRERIFDPFFTTKPHGQGTGLGLSTVYNVAEQHGGCVDCESEPGRGSTFRFFLPISEEDVEPGVEDTNVAMRCLGTETVLVVEDEERVRDMVERVLRAFGYRVLAAPDGETALRVLREEGHRVDLLLTDVVMPRMSGLELAQRVRLHQPDIKLLFISGYADERAGGGDAMSVFPLLRKPFTAGLLAHTVRETLDQS